MHQATLVVPSAAPKIIPVSSESTQPVPPMTAEEHQHATRTMAGDMRALKDGVDPFRVAHPEPIAIPTNTPTPVAAPVAPVPVMPAVPPAPVVHTAPIAPEASHPLFAPAPESAIPTAPTATETAVRNSLKQYGIDPYRETVE